LVGIPGGLADSVAKAAGEQKEQFAFVGGFTGNALQIRNPPRDSTGLLVAPQDHNAVKHRHGTGCGAAGRVAELIEGA
jgi:hypothetical protein